MAKANLHQQELQFHPRAARLSSSSLHKVPPSLCISLPKKCSSPSPLSCPRTLKLQTVCFLLQESSLALVTAYRAESCKKEHGALLVWGLSWGLADSISSVQSVAMGYWKILFLKMQEGPALFLSFPNFECLNSTLCGRRAGIFS